MIDKERSFIDYQNQASCNKVMSQEFGLTGETDRVFRKLAQKNNCEVRTTK